MRTFSMTIWTTNRYRSNVDAVEDILTLARAYRLYCEAQGWQVKCKSGRSYRGIKLDIKGVPGPQHPICWEGGWHYFKTTTEWGLQMDREIWIDESSSKKWNPHQLMVQRRIYTDTEILTGTLADTQMFSSRGTIGQSYDDLLKRNHHILNPPDSFYDGRIDLTWY